MGLSLRIIHTDSDEFDDPTLDQLHARGEIGPGTHLILLGHGENLSGKHVLHVFDEVADGEELPSPSAHETLGLLMSLRLSHDDDPASGKRRPWKGTAHVLSCGAQALGAQIAASEEALASGPTFLYGDLDSHGSSESSLALRSICEFIHQHRDETMISPSAMLAWVGRTAAVPVTLVGAEARSPIVIEPAMSVVEAMPAFLPGRLRQLQVEQSDDAARAEADRDARRLALAALGAEDGRPDSLILQHHLTRIIHEQAVNARLDKVTALLEDAPPLVHAVNAFAAPLDAAVQAANLSRYDRLARKAARRFLRPGKNNEHRGQSTVLAPRSERAKTKRLAELPNGAPLRQSEKNGHGVTFRQDSVLEAATRRLVREPGYAAVLLERACRQGDVEMFDALYQAVGVALFQDARLIRSCSNQAIPPLHLACLIDAPELVAQLLEGGAGIDQPDRSGMTALHYAVEKKSLPLVSLLKAAGADATIRCRGKNPVELAAGNGFHAGFAELADSGFWRARKLAGAPLSGKRPAPRS